MPSEDDHKLRVALCDLGRGFRGGQRQTLNLARALMYNDHEVVVICDSRGELSLRCENNGIEVIETRYSAASIFFESIKIARELRKFRVQIFNASDSHGHTLGLLVKGRIPQIGLVVTSRTGFEKSGFLSRKFKYGSGRVDRFVAISRTVASVLEKKGVPGKRIRVIYSSIDSDLFNPRGREESEIFRIGTASSLEKKKGLDMVLNALVECSGQLDRFRYKAAGIGPEQESLERMAEETGLKDNVEFPGYVEDMPEFYRSVDLYILPSRAEGLGVSLLEAGACGAVAAGSDIPGINEVIRNNIDGLLFKRDDVNDLARVIVKAYEDEGLRNKLKKAFYNKLGEFDIKYMSDQYIKLYREILKSS
jgi:glycosyltransferase involved in cell wall biosynthesis